MSVEDDLDAVEVFAAKMRALVLAHHGWGGTVDHDMGPCSAASPLVLTPGQIIRMGLSLAATLALHRGAHGTVSIPHRGRVS